MEFIRACDGVLARILVSSFLISDCCAGYLRLRPASFSFYVSNLLRMSRIYSTALSSFTYHNSLFMSLVAICC